MLSMNLQVREQKGSQGPCLRPRLHQETPPGKRCDLHAFPLLPHRENWQEEEESGSEGREVMQQSTQLPAFFHLSRLDFTKW